MVIAHIRRANPEKIGRASANTHPFEREWNGHSWVFAHNGILPGVREKAEFAARRFRPLGDTDSEHAFCVLMDAIAAAHSIDQYIPSAPKLVRTIQPVVDNLAELGEFNFLLGNGDCLIAHAHSRLYALRRSCQSGFCRQDVILLATVPLTEEPWEQLSPRTVHVYASGRERTPPPEAKRPHPTRRNAHRDAARASE
jgi:glutamine amidotransferase